MTEPSIEDFRLMGRLRAALGREPEWHEIARQARVEALSSTLGREMAGIVRKAKTEDWFYLLTIRAAAMTYGFFVWALCSLIFALAWHRHGYWHDAGIWLVIIAACSTIAAFFKGLNITINWKGKDAK